MSTRTGAITVATALLLAGTVSAEAAHEGGYQSPSRQTGTYATVFIGGALGGNVDFDDAFEIDLDSGLLFGGTMGYDNLFGGSAGDFRAEAEVSHRSQDFDGFFGNVDLTTIMGNLWYDFAMGGPLVPYAGGGLGVGFYDDDVDEGTGFAYQFGGGVNYHMSPRVMLGFNYRYLLTNVDVDNGPGNPHDDYSGHQLSASLGYYF